MTTLAISDLRVSVEDAEIIKGLTLTVKSGEVHAIMGPNGTGKSTLAGALLGHSKYHVTGGQVLLDGEDVLAWKTDERARRGLFLAMQYPVEIPGVTNANFLRAALNARRGQGNEVPVLQFMRDLHAKMQALEMDPAFSERYVNEGFSGGEKKRNEILQLSVLQPRIAILDEIDSGLDIDALRIVAEGVNRAVADGLGVIAITHYKRLLDYIRPHWVHVMLDGRIVRSGGPELAEELEERGYDWLRGSAAAETAVAHEAVGSESETISERA